MVGPCISSKTRKMPRSIRKKKTYLDPRSNVYYTRIPTVLINFLHFEALICVQIFI